MALVSSYRGFCSYASRSRAHKLRLERSLRPHFEASRFPLSLWSDAEIMVGSEWLPEIRKQLLASDFALLLMSAAFCASEFIEREELAAFSASGVPLFPVALEPLSEFHNLKGLDQNQIFHLITRDGTRKSFAQCDTRQRDRFALQLFESIVVRLPGDRS